MYFVRFPGTSGDYASTPNNAAFSAPSNFSVLALVSADDWTPAAAQFFITHDNTTGNQRSWRFAVNAGGQLSLTLNTTGAAAGDSAQQSSVATGATDGTLLWVLATRDSTSGEVKYYTAAYVPGSASPPAIGSFSQLGNTVTLVTGALFNSTTTMGVAARSVGTAGIFDGDVYRAQFYTGIYGSGSETLVRDFNPFDAADTAVTSWTAATTGETWTLNGGDPKLFSLAHPAAGTATGTAENGTPSVAPSGALITGTGTANNATAAVAPTGGAAASSGTANDPSRAIAPGSGTATAAGTAYDATVVTGTIVNAEVAFGTGTANNATTSIAPGSGSASGAGTAEGGSGSVAPGAGVATGTGTANDPQRFVSPTSGVAIAVGQAYDPTITTDETEPEPEPTPAVSRGGGRDRRQDAQELFDRLMREDDEILVLI